MNIWNQFKAENLPSIINEVLDLTLCNDKEGTCCICGKQYDNYGNNAKPYKDGRCCDECNDKLVLPLRRIMIICGMPFTK